MTIEALKRTCFRRWFIFSVFTCIVIAGYTQSETADKHIVKKGETLYSISKRYNITQQELIELNPGVENGLREGAELWLRKHNTTSGQKIEPVPLATNRSSHVVSAGDTWYSIAKKYGVSLNALQDANKAAGADLRIDQVLQIPGASISSKANDLTHKESFSVAYMLPFYTDAPDSIVNKNKKFQKASIQFYRGAMMAIDSMERSGLHAKIAFYDVYQDTNSVIKAMNKMEKAPPHLCIGPLFKESIAKTIKLLGSSTTHVVMPVQQSPKVLLLDRDISKVVPGAATEWGYLASYLLQREKLSECILLQSGNQEELKLLNAFKDEWKRNKGGLLTELNLKEATDVERLKVMLADLKNPHVVFPCSEEAGLRKLISEFGSFNMRLYGHEKWLPISDIILDIPTGFIVSAVKSNYLDITDPEVIRWIESYRITYKSEPDEFAFLGYDVSMYYLSGLAQFGASISANINAIQAPMISHVFDFVSTGAESGFENRYTHIIGIGQDGELKIENR